MKKVKNQKESSKIKYNLAIDSNIFTNKNFLNFLLWKKDIIAVHILPIVFLEVGYYFMGKDMGWDIFLKYLNRYNSVILGWDDLDNATILRKALAQKQELPFRYHFRDFLIGSQCISKNLDLVTNNIKHFQWVDNIRVFTPEELVAHIMQDQH
jgi:predicted nucleic acid-binding protein